MTNRGSASGSAEVWTRKITSIEPVRWPARSTSNSAHARRPGREVDPLEHLVDQGPELRTATDGAERDIGAGLDSAVRVVVGCAGRLVGGAGVTEALAVGGEGYGVGPGADA